MFVLPKEQTTERVLSQKTDRISDNDMSEVEAYLFRANLAAISTAKPEIIKVRVPGSGTSGTLGGNKASGL